MPGICCCIVSLMVLITNKLFQNCPFEPTRAPGPHLPPGMNKPSALSSVFPERPPATNSHSHQCQRKTSCWDSDTFSMETRHLPPGAGGRVWPPFGHGSCPVAKNYRLLVKRSSFWPDLLQGNNVCSAV